MQEERVTHGAVVRSVPEGMRRVGAVSQLTGLSTHTLRAWERRHAAVLPQRTDSGLRLYTEEDVTRLRLLKALTDKGEPISIIAKLDGPALLERLRTYQTEEVRPAESPQTPQRLGLVNRDLAEQITANEMEILPLEVVVKADSIDALLEGSRDLDVEILLLDLQLLGEDPGETLRRCRESLGPIPICVSYTFAPRAQLDQVVDAGGRLIRLPLQLAALRDQLGDFGRSHRTEQIALKTSDMVARVPHDLAAPAPDRHFTDEQLARLREISGSVLCECPNHLSALISGLIAFEEYAQSCESKSTADAALHQMLGRGTGAARSIMEELLQRLCEHDNLAL